LRLKNRERLIRLFVPLWLTYDNQKVQDGLGSQLLKLLTIKGVCDYFSIGYKHSPISGITPNHMDPFQSSKEREDFLKLVSLRFLLEESSQQSFDKIKHIDILSRRMLIREMLEAILMRRKILLKVNHAFYVSRGNPRVYAGFSRRDFFPELTKTESSKIVVIHFRQGITPSHIDTGHKTSRMLPFSYFEKHIKKILLKHSSETLRVYIVTDAPERPFIYFPPSEFIQNWREHGYHLDENFGIAVSAIELNSKFLRELKNVKILHGGNPVEALGLMSKADYLIMGRSSLSVVGAVLNKHGVCVVPDESDCYQIKNWIPSEKFLLQNS